MIHALAPGILWFLPLAAAPVLFHLFLRLRRQARTIPSLMFFLAADPHLHARRKLREWLVLALRCLALAALIAALSRPQWRGAGGGGGDVALVLVLDNSASMATVDGEGRSRLQRAVAAAQAIVEEESVRRTGVVLTVPDPAVVLPEGLAEDRAVWRSALDAVRSTQASGRPDAALAKAADWLSRELTGLAEIHVFTDAQAGEWGGAREALAMPSSVRLLVHRIGDDQEAAGDVALEGLERPRRIPVAGRPYPLVVLLRNFAARPRDVTLCLAVGSGEPVRRSLQAPAGARLRVPVSLRAEGGRDFQVRAWLEGDAASAAGEDWLTTPVTSGTPVWMVGRTEEFGLLGEALSPGGDAALSGVLAQSVALGRLRDAAAEAPAVVAISGAVELAPELSQALRDYVERGGTLLLAPGALDRRITLPAWCGVTALPGAVRPEGMALVPQAPDADLWEDLRSPEGAVTLTPLRALTWLRLEAGAGRSLLLAEDGGAALVEVPLGEGKVVASGVAWSPAWSDLPRRGAFLAMVQTLALTGQERAPVLRAGDEAGWRALIGEGADAGAGLRVEGVAGAALRAEGAAAKVPPPVRAGVYRLVSGGSTRAFSVLGEAAEADATLLKRSETPWPARSAEEVRVYRSAAETVATVRRGRRGRSLFAGFAVLALLAALAESVLAQRALPTTARGTSKPAAEGDGHE